jgi:hypothetical protein
MLLSNATVRKPMPIVVKHESAHAARSGFGCGSTMPGRPVLHRAEKSVKFQYHGRDENGHHVFKSKPGSVNSHAGLAKVKADLRAVIDRCKLILVDPRWEISLRFEDDGFQWPLNEPSATPVQDVTISVLIGSDADMAVFEFEYCRA